MNKFKDSMNRFRTISLFKETVIGDKSHVLFTIDEARQLYIEANDPTGYKFATEHLGGWKHWLALKNSDSVNKFIEEWEYELEVKLRSQGVANMVKLSVGDRGYQASKFLIDGGWVDKKAGRPTKEAIKKEVKMAAKNYSEFDDVSDLRPH